MAVNPRFFGFVLNFCLIIQALTGLLFVVAGLLKLADGPGTFARAHAPNLLTPRVMGFWGFIILANWEFAIGLAIILYHNHRYFRRASILTLSVFIIALTIMLFGGQQQCGCISASIQIHPLVILTIDIVSLTSLCWLDIYGRRAATS